MSQSSSITSAELVVLKVLWQHPGQLSADIVNAVQQSQDWHEKTIKTLINRLVKKQAVSFEKHGRAYVYSPIISEAQYQRDVSSSLINKVFSGKVSSLVSGFADQGKLDDEDVQSLKQIIEEWEQREDSSHD